MPRNKEGEYVSRRINLKDPQEVVERVANARKFAKYGATAGSIVPLGGSAVGGALGAISGFILGDREIVFPMDMVAIPAYQMYLLGGIEPVFQIYIKEGEVLNQVQPTDAQTAMGELDLPSEAAMASFEKKPRKRSKWNIYTSKKANQIRFKSGKRKGLLNLKAMGVAYRKANKKKGGKK